MSNDAPGLTDKLKSALLAAFNAAAQVILRAVALYSESRRVSIRSN
jgi:hypothetical protein